MNKIKKTKFHNGRPGNSRRDGILLVNSAAERSNYTIPVCDFIAWQTGGARGNFALAGHSFAIQLCNSTGLISRRQFHRTPLLELSPPPLRISILCPASLSILLLGGDTFSVEIPPKPSPISVIRLIGRLIKLAIRNAKSVPRDDTGCVGTLLPCI